MGKVATKTVDIGGGISLAIPKEIDLNYSPSPTAKLIFDNITNPANWKLPTQVFETQNEALANEVKECLDFYLGGSEMERVMRDGGGVAFRVKSKGYYAYVGA